MEPRGILFLLFSVFIGLFISLLIYIILRLLSKRKNPTTRIMQSQLLGHDKEAINQINKELKKDDNNEYEYFFLNYDKIQSLLSLYNKYNNFKHLEEASNIIDICQKNISIEKYPPIKEEYAKLRQEIDNEIKKK